MSKSLTCLWIILLWWYLPAFAQTDTTASFYKLYTTNRNFKLNKFVVDSSLLFVQPINRSNFTQYDNEYYFYKNGERRSIAYLLRMYGYIQHQNEWYLNTARLGLGQGFNKVLALGKYWVVLAAASLQDTDQIDIRYDKQQGVFLPDTSIKVARQYMYYAIDTSNFESTALTFAGMLKLLSAYPSLQMQFVKDKYNDDPFVILAYIKELNRYIAYFEKNK